MKRGVRRILAVTGVLCIGLAFAAAWFLAKAMPIGTGYVAKYLCTSTFLSKRDPQVVFVEDIKPVNPLAKLISWDTDAFIADVIRALPRSTVRLAFGPDKSGQRPYLDGVTSN